MAQASKSEVVELRPGLTARSLTIGLILTAVYAVLTAIVRLYTDKPNTFGGFILPMIYLVAIFEVLGRANPKLRLTPQEWTFMFTLFVFLATISHLTFHAPANEVSLGWTAIMIGDYAAFGIGDLRDYWSQAVPAAVVPPEPLRFEVANMLVNGRSPGQPIPWGAVIGPIVYWGLAILFYGFLAIFVTFSFGKPWVEEERLVFPLAIPSLYLFREAGEVAPGANKSRLFDLSIPATKVFWAMFFIGFISSIYVVLSEILPVFPIGAWWGETKVNLPFLAAIWPGIYASAIFFIPQIAVGLMMPNDVLITLILGWVIFGVLYQGIGVAMGIIPYQPGMEYVWPWEDYPGHWMPFPYNMVGRDGVALSIAIWMLFKYRSRIAALLSTLWKKDVVENGLSMRLVTALMVVGFFGWYALMLIEQADPLVALLVPVWAIIWNIMYARVFAEVFWHVGTGWGETWDITYQFGVLTRGWPPPEAVTWDHPNTNPAWFTIARHMTNFDEWVVSFGPMSSGIQITLYKLAHDLRMRMRDFLIGLVIGLIVLAFVLIPLEVYFSFATKGGINQLPTYASWWPWIAAGRCHRGRWMPEGVTPQVTAGLLFGFGILLGLALYALKSAFTWFWFINVPALYVAMTIANYMWLTSLIALILKYVAIRTVGIRRYEEYAMPVVAGWILGFGAPWLIALLINMATATIPRFVTLYQP